MLAEDCDGVVGGIQSETVLDGFCWCPQPQEYILPHLYEWGSIRKKKFLLAPCFLNDTIYLAPCCTQM